MKRGAGYRRRWVATGGITIAALAIAGLRIVINAPDPEAAARLTTEAERLAGADRLDEATARLAEAKRADPGSARPYLVNFELLERSAHDREAVQELLAAHAIASRDPKV